MKKELTLIALLLLVAASLAASEDWRGNNRLTGLVVDKKTGAPVKGATVKLRIQKGASGGPDVATDNNGKWAVLGLAAGAWNIDIEAAGYVTAQGSLSIQEGARLPPRKVEIEPAIVASSSATAPEAPPVEEVKVGGQVVSKDIAEAVEAGNVALTAKNFKDAVASYEKASAALPTVMPIRFALARAYYGAGDLKKAVATMSEVYTADPANVRNAMLYANMLLEDGQLEKGKAIVDKLPADAVDATALTNIGIVLMNKKQPAAARDYFTKVIESNPKDADGYYYRGLATIQAGKAKEAKSDLQKVIELAPDSDQAKEAKEYLKSIK
jgi:tetratricopeptide (TPR) repeat protein